MKIHVRPADKSIKDPSDFKLEDLPEFSEELKAELEQSRSKVSKVLEKSQNEPEYPKFTFLGTGSSVPNKYRNVSCILVESSKDSYVILDCGEGSLLQLHRQFGHAKSCDILRKLKGIYISHLHADHHIGLIALVICLHLSNLFTFLKFVHFFKY